MHPHDMDIYWGDEWTNGADIYCIVNHKKD